jgi:agmatine/peptidylarginine deiminase
MKFLPGILLVSSFAFANAITAQTENEKILPKGFSPEEIQLLQSGGYDFNNTNSRGISTPPAFPVRTMAQWEEVQALVIAWTSFPGIQTQMVDAAQEEADVIILCADSNAVKNTLTNAGVPLVNLDFIETSFNSIWIRDYGAHTVYKNEVDSLLLIDWIYNRPRPDDDVTPDAYAAHRGIGLHATTANPNRLMNTGGNWMVDGFGTAFASELILDENDGAGDYSLNYPVHTEAEIDAIMNDFMGITRYIKMPTLPYDGIHHIDMHMKLTDEETILMGEYPIGVSDGPQIELNMDYVATNFNSVFGTPYKWVRIPQPPSTGGAHPSTGGYYRTYCNNVIINKTVLVPFYRTEYDTIAQRILEGVYPGYTIVGIDVDNSGSALISQSGAIHCISNLIGADNPLLISHQELVDTYDDVNPYFVEAYITNKSGISNATLYWSLTEGSGYSAVTMTPGSQTNYWEANIPAQTAGSRIYYYIHAESNNGKQQVRPMTAPTGNFTFQVLDNTASVENNESAFGFGEIFPNPADVIVWIPIVTDVEFNGKVELFDMAGRHISNLSNGHFGIGKNDIFLDVSTLPQGIYQIVLTTDSVRKTAKLMVK